MDNRQNDPASRGMIRGLPDAVQERLTLVHAARMASVFSEKSGDRRESVHRRYGLEKRVRSV